MVWLHYTLKQIVLFLIEPDDDNMPPAKEVEEEEEQDKGEKGTFNDFDHMCSIKRLISDAATHVKISFQFGVLFPDPLQPSHLDHFCLTLSIFSFKC